MIMPPEDDSIPPKFFDFVSQVAHFFTTYALTFTVGVFLPKLAIAAGTACFLYAGVHEFWYDPKHESPAVRGSDIKDFVFLVLGAGVGVLAAHFVHR